MARVKGARHSHAKQRDNAARGMGDPPGLRGSAAAMMYRQSCKYGHKPGHPRCGPKCQQPLRVWRTGTYLGEKSMAEQLGVSVAKYIRAKVQELAPAPANPRAPVYDWGITPDGQAFHWTGLIERRPTIAQAPAGGSGGIGIGLDGI